VTTSRTLVRQTLEFEKPARVPRQAWILPWAEARFPEWVARLRAYFLPMYADYAAVARQHGKFVFMHSDGSIVDILDDLIAVGVDAINCQVACMGVAELGRRFRGRLTFWGEIDRQDVLAFGSTAQVDAAVQDIRQRLYADGGLIAQCEFGPGAIPENVIQVFHAWQALDLEQHTDGEAR
jgi:uroporphyrinogen decarboxylase